MNTPGNAARLIRRESDFPPDALIEETCGGGAFVPYASIRSILHETA